MGDLATLLTAIGGILAAVGPVVTLAITLRRVSPKERTDAVANTRDAGQDTRIAQLEQQLRELLGSDEDGEES